VPQQYDFLGGVQSGQDWVKGLYQDRAQVQAGRALQGGNFGAASGALLGAGDLQGGLALRQRGQQEQVAQQSQQEAATAEQLQFTLNAARGLKEARSRGENVLEAYNALAPALQQMGTSPQQIAQLGEQIASNPGILDQIEQISGQQLRELEFRNAGQDVLVLDKGTGAEVARYNQSPTDYSLGTTRFSGETNQPVAQGYIAPEVIQRDPTKELIEVTPGVAPAGGRGGSAQPRGIRNNNPGNIEDGAFARSLPGYKGSDGRFAIFETPEQGVQAGGRLLDSYAQRGVDTPAEIINRWAPPSDGNPTQDYAAYVAGRLGIGVNDPVPANRRAEAFQAINEFENGSRGPSQGTGGGPRVLASATQGAQQGGSILSPEEVTAAGLAPGTVAQRSTTGQISILQAAPGAGRQGNPTEAQNKDSFNANRMARAGSIINRLEDNNYDFGRARLGGQLTENYRRYDAAAQEWTDSILRLTTGAAATADEVASNRRSYFPEPGDSIAVRQQKRQQREAVERDALARGQGGRSSSPQAPSSTSSRTRPQTNAPGLRFNITPQQLETRQSIIGQGQRGQGRLGTPQNPYYLNPADARGSYANLPSGSQYVSPDGQIRVKR